VKKNRKLPIIIKSAIIIRKGFVSTRINAILFTKMIIIVQIMFRFLIIEKPNKILKFVGFSKRMELV